MASSHPLHEANGTGSPAACGSSQTWHVIHTTCLTSPIKSIWFPKHTQGLCSLLFLNPWICKDLHIKESLTNRILHNCCFLSLSEDT